MKKNFLITTSLSLFVLTASAQWTPSGNDIYNTNGGKVSIGSTMFAAKLNVYEGNTLGSVAKNSSLLSSISGNAGSNIFQHNIWLVRNATGSDWYTARIHDGVSIDNAFLNPQTDTRTWWERDPSADIQSWGNIGNSYMTLNGGKLGIGTTTPDEKLTVNGTIHATTVKVTSTVPVPDYVFKKSYVLRPLSALRRYLDANSHLPEIPSANAIEQNGINLGEMNMQLLKKVEELTLYLLEKDRELKKEHDQNQAQQKQLNLITQKLNKLSNKH